MQFIVRRPSFGMMRRIYSFAVLHAVTALYMKTKDQQYQERKTDQTYSRRQITYKSVYQLAERKKSLRRGQMASDRNLPFHSFVFSQCLTPLARGCATSGVVDLVTPLRTPDGGC